MEKRFLKTLTIKNVIVVAVSAVPLRSIFEPYLVHTSSFEKFRAKRSRYMDVMIVGFCWKFVSFNDANVTRISVEAIYSYRMFFVARKNREMDANEKEFGKFPNFEKEIRAQQMQKSLHQN